MKTIYSSFYIFVLLLFLLQGCQNESVSNDKTSVNQSNQSSNTKTADDDLNQFVLDGHEIMNTYEADLNRDGRKDVLLILKIIDEASVSDIDNPAPRPLLILTRKEDNTLQLAQRNDQTILCYDCGGTFGDPFTEITVNGSFFSVEHYGGSSWKWIRNITYRYDAESKNWYLFEDRSSSISPDLRTIELVKRTESFDDIAFKDFNINKDLDKKYITGKSEEMTYESAVVYAAATDYVFKNENGELVKFRVSDVEENPNLRLPNNLLDTEAEEGPPGPNPDLVGKKMQVTYDLGNQIQKIRMASENQDIKIRMGTKLQDIQTLNGKPFMLVGFEVDRDIAGKVMDWKEGKLTNRGIQFEVTKELSIEEYQQILGDDLFSSDHPVMKKAGLEVVFVD